MIARDALQTVVAYICAYITMINKSVWVFESKFTSDLIILSDFSLKNKKLQKN